jgi:spore coat protein CotH
MSDSEISDIAQEYNSDWTSASHGDAIPNYNEVFPQDEVNRLEIEMSSDQWDEIRDNMKDLYGYDFGSSAMAGGDFADEDPVYVDVTLTYNGKTWKNVGYRLKGNSSLSTAWGQGNYKLPFRLNFDRFEDEIIAVTDQRFYGFKELSFSPGYQDESLMREKLTPEIFKMAGIAACETAFYRVYINIGDGLKYYGLYTAVEIPDDTMIAEQFGENSGNMYKPESTFSYFDEDEMNKKNNDDYDYSDIEDFVSVLNSSDRTTDTEVWRANLEKTFNVDYFLNYLAVNNAIVNWDSYGVMAHNHYLYNHSDNKLCWIPWDHNEALSGSPGITGSTFTGTGPGGGPGGGGGTMNHEPLSLSMNEVSSSWPLINYLVNDDYYMQVYKDHMTAFNNESFDLSVINDLIDKYYTMIEPYAIGENGEQDGYTYLLSEYNFIGARNELKEHLEDRKSLVEQFLQ